MLSRPLLESKVTDDEVAELESRIRLDDMGSEIVFEEEALDVVEGFDEELRPSSLAELLRDR